MKKVEDYTMLIVSYEFQGQTAFVGRAATIQRAKQYLSQNPSLRDWAFGLYAKMESPEIVVLEELPDDTDAAIVNAKRRHWTLEMRKRKMPLLNKNYNDGCADTT